jgi:hypothetical protein
LSKLAKKLPDNGKKLDKNRPPFIFSLLKKCEHYHIDYTLMCDLNYNDLLALVIEYDISAIKEHFEDLQKQKNDSRGINVVKANDEQVARMHNRQKKKDR